MPPMSPLECFASSVPRKFVTAFLSSLYEKNITSFANHGAGAGSLLAVSEHLRGKSEQEIGDLGSVVLVNLFTAGIFSGKYQELERILHAEIPNVASYFVYGKGTTFVFCPISLDRIHPQIIELANELAGVFANAYRDNCP